MHGGAQRIVRNWNPPPQSDENLLRDIARRSHRDPLILAEIIELLSAKNLPPQLVQVSFVGRITANNTPAVLIPRNPNRQSFVVGQTGGITTHWAYSYDQPQAIDGGLFAGLELAGDELALESNGSVSINDICIWTIDAAAFPVFFVGYEGRLSPTGNSP